MYEDVVAPINAILGVPVTPVNPNDALVNETCPETPSPPATNRPPVNVEVEAVPEVTNIPETNNLSELALYDNKESEDTAEPDANCAGVNSTGWKTSAAPAVFTTIFCDVLPDELATKGTQLIIPVEVDCKTELPVAGDVAGKV